MPDTISHDPAMIAHARLVVIGGDCHRLHEEIIAAGGRLEGGKFVPLNVGQTDKILAAATSQEPSEEMKKRFLNEYNRHTEALAKAMENRMKDRTKGLEKRMREREAKEIDDIRAILTELKRTIEEKLNAPELQQMVFEGWAEPEREQLERNMHALRARVLEIPAEIERETTAIRARFADPQPRMFPISVTFLVPERLARGS
jgi:hypothetical protein